MLLAGSCWWLRSRRGGELPAQLDGGEQKTRLCSLSIRPLSNRVVVIAAAEDHHRGLLLLAFTTDK